MTLIEDPELLRRYAEQGDERAFAELVRRRVDVVYAVALRRVGGDVQLAEDVTQRVFTDLARKAAGLSRRAVIGGWLYRSAQFAATDVVRAERRRKVRETEAAALREHELGDGDARPGCVVGDHGAGRGAAVDWDQVRPVLDQAMGELSDGDRDAVWLRFFEGRSFAEVGARLRLAENSARMRVERALDKLHAALAKRGVNSTTTALGVALGSQAVSASAPAGLAASATGAALAGGGGGAQVIFMSLIKSKFFLTVGAMVLVGGTAFFWEQLTHDRVQRALRDENSRLQRQMAALRTEAHENIGVRAENARLREALASATPAAMANRTSSVVDGNSGLTPDHDGKKSRDAWRNVGRATPGSAYETVMWASDRGDVDVLVTAFTLNDVQRAEAEAIFNRLPEESRAKYVTPERMLALLFASGTPAAWQLIAETANGADDVGLRARVWNDRGETNELELPFHRYADGWRVVIPDWQMNKSLARLKK